MRRGLSVRPGIRPRFAIGVPSISLMSPVKSIGVAPGDVRADGERVHGRALLREVADAVGGQAARHGDRHVREAGLVEPGPHLGDERRGDPAALRRGVEADAVQPVAEGVGDAQRLLGLVLERVHEHDPRHVRGHVAVERLGGPHGVAEDQHQRVGHGARGVEAGEPGPGRASMRRRTRRRSPRSRGRR